MKKGKSYLIFSNCLKIKVESVFAVFSDFLQTIQTVFVFLLKNVLNKIAFSNMFNIIYNISVLKYCYRYIYKKYILIIEIDTLTIYYHSY